LGTLLIQSVEPADFQHGCEIMEKTFSSSGSREFQHAQAAIAEYCQSKFAVGHPDSAEQRAQKSRELLDALTARLLYWVKFMRRNFGLLQNRGLIIGNKQHNILTEAAAYVPLDVDRDGFDPEELLAEVDRRLGREHIPVHPAETKLIPRQLQEFLEGFAVLRTMATHIDWETRAGEYYEDELTKEVNEWIALNPVFTKQDLSVLKEAFRKHGISKNVWKDLIQDMRGKTFQDLRRMLYPWFQGDSDLN